MLRPASLLLVLAILAWPVSPARAAIPARATAAASTAAYDSAFVTASASDPAASALTGAVQPNLAQPPAQEPPPGAAPTITAADDGLTLEWHAGDPQIIPLENGLLRVVIPGYDSPTQPGQPDLPQARALAAVPPGAEPLLEVLETYSRSLELPGAVAPVALPTPDFGPLRIAEEAVGQGGTLEMEPGAALAPSPRPVIALEELGVVRGVRLVSVVFNPVYQVEGQWRLAETLRVRLVFTLSAASAEAARMAGRNHAARGDEFPAGEFIPTDPLLSQLQTLVINPGQVSQAPSPAFSIQPAAAAPLTAAVEVGAAGLTQLTYAGLAAAGFPLNRDPRTLRLTRAGEEVALEWQGDTDAAFEPGERFIFYAEPRPSRWTTTDTYLLAWGDAPARRIADQDGAPGAWEPGTAWREALLEKNALYTPDCYCGVTPLGHDGDRWAWLELSRPGRPAQSVPFSLTAVRTDRPARLTIWLIGYTALPAAPDHRVTLTLNGVALGTLEWDGKSLLAAELDVPAGVLREGQNTLALALPGIAGAAVEGAWLDAFRVSYPVSAASLGPAALVSGESATGAASASLGAASSSAEAAAPAAIGADLTETSSLDPETVGANLTETSSLDTGTVSANTAETISADPAAAAADFRRYTLTLDSTAGLRVYDVSQPAAPLRLSGVVAQGGQVSFGGAANARYALAAESGLLQPAGLRLLRPLQTAATPGADYLVISHASFAPALGPLLALRQRQGLTTAVEDVQAIYDAYSGGRPDPAAIRAFIRQAYQAWSPRPLYVLLVGDGASDPKRYQPGSRTTWVPPMLAEVDPWLGETAADNLYVTVDGADHLPDLLIGRLPVNSLAEAQAVVDKLVRYETNPAPGPWPARLTSIADDAESEGDYPLHAEAMLAGLEGGGAGGPVAITRAHYLTTTTGVEGMRAAVLEGFRGSGVILYTGHASIHQWGAENFFHLNQIGGLGNSGRLPFLLEMDCLTASFQVAGFDTLDETLLRAPGGGVVAAWGSTGLGIPTAHQILAQTVLRSLFAQGQPPAGLAVAGLSTAQAKTQLAAAQPGYTFLLDTYTLLGDPATRINVQATPQTAVFLPVIRK